MVVKARMSSLEGLRETIASFVHIEIHSFAALPQNLLNRLRFVDFLGGTTCD